MTTHTLSRPEHPVTVHARRIDADRSLQLRKVLFGFGIAMVPVTIPRGPGNLALADVGITACVALVLLSASYRDTVLRVPYLLGMGMMIVAGLLATLVAGASLTSALAVLQDVMMLAWAMAIANAGRDPRVLGVILRTWVASASFYAVLVAVGMLAGIDALAGRTETYGYRASFLLGDPNVSGNYFLLGFFLLLTTQWPRRRVARYPMALLLLSAVAFSGSNGALLGLVAGFGIAFFVGLMKRHGLVAVACVLGALVAAVVSIGPHVNPQTLQQKAADSIPLLRDGVGRTDQSSSEREKLAAESIHLWLSGNLIGIGPAQTKATFTQLNAPYVKEAHNDSFASLNERGLLGILGLVVLGATVAVKLGRVISSELRPEYAALFPRPEYLLAAGITMAIAGLFYEVLHFRHLWALLGVVAAADLWGRRS